MSKQAHASTSALSEQGVPCPAAHGLIRSGLHAQRSFRSMAQLVLGRQGKAHRVWSTPCLGATQAQLH